MMMSIPHAFIFTAIVLTLAAGAVGMARETKIKRSDLPAAVEKTVAAQSKGAFSEEKENGATITKRSS